MKKITEFDTDIIVDLFSYISGKDIDQVYETLKKLEEHAWSKYPTAKSFKLEVREGFYDDTEIYFRGQREETDAEYNKRIERQQKAREKSEKLKKDQEAKERALLAKLKAKYGDC